MKKVLYFLTVAILSTPASFAGTLEDKTSCVIWYNKSDNFVANLNMACDGELIFSHKVKLESELANPRKFKDDIFTAFQIMSDENKVKSCQQYESEKLWWAFCNKKSN